MATVTTISSQEIGAGIVLYHMVKGIDGIVILIGLLVGYAGFQPGFGRQLAGIAIGAQWRQCCNGFGILSAFQLYQCQLIAGIVCVYRIAGYKALEQAGLFPILSLTKSLQLSL